MLIEKGQHLIGEIAPTNGDGFTLCNVHRAPQGRARFSAKAMGHHIRTIILIEFRRVIARFNQHRRIIHAPLPIHALDNAFGERHPHQCKAMLKGKQSGWVFTAGLKWLLRGASYLIDRKEPAFRQGTLQVQGPFRFAGWLSFHNLKSLAFEHPQHHVEATSTLQRYGMDGASNWAEFMRNRNPFLMEFLVAGHANAIGGQKKFSRCHNSPSASPYPAGGYQPTFPDPLGTGVGRHVHHLQSEKPS